MNHNKNQLPEHFTYNATDLIRRSLLTTIGLTALFFVVGQLVSPVNFVQSEDLNQKFNYEFDLCPKWSVVDTLAEHRLYFDITGTIIENSVGRTLSEINSRSNLEELTSALHQVKPKNQFLLVINVSRKQGGEQIIRQAASVFQSNLIEDLSRITSNPEQSEASQMFAGFTKRIIAEKGVFIELCGNRLTITEDKLSRFIAYEALERILTMTMFALLISLSWHVALLLVNRSKSGQ